ncbi:MAG TPA: hypothetical protein VIS94_14650 [Desulfomonilia bacterium]|jgi:hypothetical protein
MVEMKKSPKYLEEVTFSDDLMPWQKGKIDFTHSELFLGRYSKDDLMGIMEKTGLMNVIRKKGYKDIIITISREDFISRLYVNYERYDKETRLVELILREGMFRPKEVFIPRFDFSGGLHMILVEWLALQDPAGVFSPEKPRLPGQAYPGLGGLRNLQAMLYFFGENGGKEAVVDVPQHYHAAVIYSRLYSSIYKRLYSFFSPVDAGQLEAMSRDLVDRPLADVSLAISNGCLIDVNTGETKFWRPSEQIYPTSALLREYVDSEEYKEIVEDSFRNSKYAIDWERYDKLKQQGLSYDA